LLRRRAKERTNSQRQRESVKLIIGHIDPKALSMIVQEWGLARPEKRESGVRVSKPDPTQFKAIQVGDQTNATIFSPFRGRASPPAQTIE
jgi:hypothetical protein